MTNVILVPAYGRDYKSAEAAKADFVANKDFQAITIQGSGYTTRDELIKLGTKGVTIRYAKRLKSVFIYLE